MKKGLMILHVNSKNLFGKKLRNPDMYPCPQKNKKKKQDK